VTGVALEGVRASYGDREVLRGIDLEVLEGELLVVLGPSGSGKTTMLRVIAGLEPVTAGRVRVAGRDVTRARPGRRNVSMVFQSYALFPHLTVLANICFGLEVRNVRGEAGRLRATEAARAAGCADLLDRRPGELSGGERQRVALARALVRQPDAFLLDEPLSNLDAELRVQTRTELKALHARVGATTIHVTHDQTEALVLGDRVAVLRDGLVEQIGTPDEIWSEPATLAVARFVGSPAMNVLTGDGPLRPRSLSGSPDDPVRRGIRADALVLGPVGAPGAVEQVELVGADAYVHVRVGPDRVVVRVPASGRPRPGDQVRVSAADGDWHLFDAGSGVRLRR